MKELLGVILCACVVLCSCKKESSNEFIPYVPVQITKNINNPDMINVQTVGGWTYLNGGSRGLIVYRFSEEEIKTYERHSPFEVERACQVKVDSSNISISDPCSDSRWNITYGDPIGGEATRALLQYSTNFDGNTIQIRN